MGMETKKSPEDLMRFSETVPASVGDEMENTKPSPIRPVTTPSSYASIGATNEERRLGDDETVEEAAVREAIEEAGVRGDLLDFIGFYNFKSKTHQDEFSPEGLCKAAMFALLVKEELSSWPEQSTRMRHWLTIPEALQSCRHEWMKDALENGFCEWLAQNK
ncbi:hypothetical protein GQ457_09G026190 [Hibiscus cannabinus]